MNHGVLELLVYVVWFVVHHRQMTFFVLPVRPLPGRNPPWHADLLDLYQVRRFILHCNLPHVARSERRLTPSESDHASPTPHLIPGCALHHRATLIRRPIAVPMGDKRVDQPRHAAALTRTLAPPRHRATALRVQRTHRAAATAAAHCAPSRTLPQYLLAHLTTLRPAAQGVLLQV